MLEDERAAGFYEAFAGEWLSLPNLAYSDPDPALYAFDEELRSAMETETLLFVQEVVDGGLPLSTLLSSDFTFVNERLAEHYGITGVTGPEFRRVTLTGAERGGILSHGSILTVTSHPDRTSPVKRGKWILDQLLCEPPPDPPPDVDTFIGGRPEGETLRERLERHRERAECAVCHDSIDPLGLGLENYDAVGRWRTEDNGDAVDPSGVLPDGRTFDDAHGLTSILSVDERTTGCITEKLLAYALGRGLSASDRCYVEELLGGTSAASVSVRDLIVRIVTNDVFRRIGGREDEP
jgi:hypothetical protein